MAFGEGPRAVTLRPRLAWTGLSAMALAFSAFVAGGAQAQINPPVRLPPPPKPAAPRPDDGLAGGGFYLEADEVISDPSEHHVQAKGGVQARYKGRVLRADQLDYDSQTGIVTARGSVKIINGDGTAQFADAISLDKDLTEGVALGFSTRLGMDVKIAAASAVRQSADVQDLSSVVFTPCQVCAENGQSKPTWSIRAREVIEDKKHQTLHFKHAVIQIKGVPVLYLPALWTADPSADRKSGLLLPLATISGTRGFSYEQPYYQVISSSQDITIAPQISSKVNPVLNIDWRKRFYSGVVDIRAGYTYDQDFTSGGDKFGSPTSRSYILGAGLFDLNSAWQWGFTAERTSDPLLFQKYSVPDVYQDRGLYAADDQRLISQIFAVRQDQTSYLSVAAISVQGLRPTDTDSTIPLIAPLIEGRWEAPGEILGGRLRVDGSAVVLSQHETTNEPTIPGVDSRRASVEADWRRTFTLSDGLRLSPFILARGDLYSVGDEPPPQPSPATIARGFGTLGMDVSYPLIKRDGAATWILEPLAQIDISPNPKLDPRIPDEDSVVWELDETNLFDPNSSPGFDVYEGGQRLNVGGRATLMVDDGREASLMLGRSLATRSEPAIPLYSGLEPALSDYVVAAEATPLKGVSLFSRWLLNPSGLAIDRLETGVDLTSERLAGYIRYLQEADSPSGVPIRDLDVKGEAYATRHWGLTANLIRDVLADAWRREEVGLIYRDDCIKFEVVYRRDETVNRTLGPSTSVVFHLMLATFGNSGYTH